MSFGFLIKAIATSAAIFVGAAASAATVDFKFGTGTNVPGPLEVSSGGLTVSVDTEGTAINRDTRGWGVSGSGQGHLNNGESLSFDFGESTLLTNVAITERAESTGSTFELLVDGLSVGTFSSDGSATKTAFDFGAGYTGSTFEIVAVDSDGPSVFRVRELTVDNGIAPVPLPPAAPALAGALVLGGIVLRRRKAKS